jgi:hypothetical protein
VTGSDDEHDDPQLRSLRAVWLAMPDEDPPDRGLSELMAAARQQAAVMTEVGKPSWWRRALVQLMRPPVLALATVMILLGGAVLVTSSKKGDVSSEPAPVESAPSPAIEAADHPAPSPTAAIGGAGSASATDSSTAKLAAPDVAKHAASPPKSVSRPPRKPVAKSASEPGLDTVAPDRGDRGGFASPPPPPPAAAPAPAKPDDSEDEAPTTRGPVTRDAKKANDDAQPRQQLVDQLLAQCRAATTRGDCESAKLIAKRIAAADSAFYAAHVSTDAAIAKCLAH